MPLAYRAGESTVRQLDTSTMANNNNTWKELYTVGVVVNTWATSGKTSKCYFIAITNQYVRYGAKDPLGSLRSWP